MKGGIQRRLNGAANGEKDNCVDIALGVGAFLLGAASFCGRTVVTNRWATEGQALLEWRRGKAAGADNLRIPW